MHVKSVSVHEISLRLVRKSGRDVDGSRLREAHKWHLLLTNMLLLTFFSIEVNAFVRWHAHALLRHHWHLHRHLLSLAKRKHWHLTGHLNWRAVQLEASWRHVDMKLLCVDRLLCL